jgi:hypothetical protein
MTDLPARPTVRQRQILQAMRQGKRLAEGKSKYAIAFLDDSEEVDLRTVGLLQDAGWIYRFDDLDGKGVWGLTQHGLDIIG